MKKKRTGSLVTERANPAARDLDLRSALEIARIINREDARVPAAVRKALPEIARAIEAVIRGLRRGGRLIYVGAGTSGRLAALDASECPPTFNTSPRTVQYVMAGGARALSSAVEAHEDSSALGRRDLMRRKPTRNDVVVGISAGGRTPYVLGALAASRRAGATAIAVTCNHGSPLAKLAKIAIVTPVGPEVVSGSSRMKAGSAHKMVLNIISTGAMTRLGYVYDNLMVNVHLKNAKLRRRGLNILQRAASLDRAAAQRALRAAGGSLPAALVMAKARVDRKEAERRLRAAKEHVRMAIAGRRAPVTK